MNAPIIVHADLKMRAALLALAMFAGAVQAQGWPAKPIRWIVPYPGGGITDVVTRMVSYLPGWLGSSATIQVCNRHTQDVRRR